VLRIQQFHFRVLLPLGGPRGQAERGMALAAIMSFDGRVAESSRVPHSFKKFWNKSKRFGFVPNFFD
jgi:hypothetical protein